MYALQLFLPLICWVILISNYHTLCILQILYWFLKIIFFYIVVDVVAGSAYMRTFSDMRFWIIPKIIYKLLPIFIVQLETVLGNFSIYFYNISLNSR